jgi:hypothetical protein
VAFQVPAFLLLTAGDSVEDGLLVYLGEAFVDQLVDVLVALGSVAVGYFFGGEGFAGIIIDDSLT